MSRLYPEITSPVVSSPYKRSPFKRIDLSNHRFSTKNLDLPSISFPATKSASGSTLSSSTSTITRPSPSAAVGRMPISRYKSPFLRQGIRGTDNNNNNNDNNINNNSKLTNDVRKPVSSSTISSSSRALSSPRRTQLATRNLRERPTRLGMSMSERKPPREERLGRILDTGLRSSRVSHKRTHSNSSTQSPAFSPRPYSSVSKFGFEPITTHYNKSRNDEIMKRRKVVAFVESIDEKTPTAVSKTIRSPVDDMVISDSEEEETPLKSKQLSSAMVLAREKAAISMNEKGSDSTADKQLFSTANATSEASAVLELECEIKQIQLDNLRKFKNLQAQMELQAKQIQALHEQNNQLLAMVSKK